jgi:predicted acylesterase/phospholipase RssA
MLFEPVELGGHRYVDGGVFSNQPLHAALADGADALIVVLLSPGQGPSPEAAPRHLMALGFRLLEIANWRDLQAELGNLPHGWSRDPAAVGEAARVCVVEPREELPGGMYGYSSESATELIRRGTEDMWRALERAGWLVAADEEEAEQPPPEEARPRGRGWRRFSARRGAAR